MYIAILHATVREGALGEYTKINNTPILTRCVDVSAFSIWLTDRRTGGGGVYNISKYLVGHLFRADDVVRGGCGRCLGSVQFWLTAREGGGYNISKYLVLLRGACHVLMTPLGTGVDVRAFSIWLTDRRTGGGGGNISKYLLRGTCSALMTSLGAGVDVAWGAFSIWLTAREGGGGYNISKYLVLLRGACHVLMTPLGAGVDVALGAFSIWLTDGVGGEGGVG